MADLHHQWGDDLDVAPGGDLRLADGQIVGDQRVLRRLLTAPGEYLWNLEYGAGLGRYVGQPIEARRLESVILSQLRLEPQVAQTPTPLVEVPTAAANWGGGYTVHIEYQSATTGTPHQIAIPVRK